MSYIETRPTSSFASATSQTFTGNNSTTAFTLNRRVSAPEDLEVFVSNVQQQPTGSYTIGSNGLTLTFSEAPPSGQFYVVYRSDVTPSVLDPNGARTNQNNTFTGNVDITGNFTVSADTDASVEIGRAHIGNAIGISDFAGFSHVDRNSLTDYALLQYSTGTTYVNAPTGQSIRLRINNSDIGQINSGGLYLYNSKIIVFEGSSINSNETSLTVTDPTADRIITLPDATGTVALQNASIDMNGTELILDADADTSITADTDDQVDIKVGGTDTVVIKPDVFEIKGSHPDLKLMDTDDNNYGGLFYNNGSISLATDHDATGATGTIKFVIDGSEKARITDAGNIGVGVSPESAVKLEVNAGSDGAVGISARSDGGNGNNRRFNLIPFASGGTYGGGLRVQSRNSSNVFETALEVDNSKILTHYAQSNWQTNGASTALYFKDASNSNYGVCGFEPATYNGGTNRWYTQNSTNFAIAYGGVNGFFMKYDTRQVTLSNNGQNYPGSTVHQLTLGYNLGGNKGGLYMPTYSYYNDVNFKIVNNDSNNGRQSDDILFFRNGSRHGGIRIIGASGVSYQSISDYREKTDEKPIEDAIGTIKKLKPYNFKWKKSGKRQDGFFAHEVDEILDYAVSGEKDATKTYEGVVLNKEGNMIASEIKKEDFDKRLDDGEDEEASPIGETTYPEGSTWKETYEDIEPQQMDPAKLVPMLTACLQEAIAKIETLETKVKALESK